MAYQVEVQEDVLGGALENIEIVNEGYIAGNLGPKDELLPGDSSQPRRFRRKVIRRIEVPYVRKVKVPVVTKDIVPCEIEKRIVIKKAIEVVDYEEVDEEYTDYVDESGVRQKEVWKESIEMKEEVRERRVAKIRMVKRPVTKIIEEDCEQTVKVQSTRIEEVQAWRLDEVTEMREVEDIHYEVYDLIAHAHEDQDHEVLESREIGVVESGANNRTHGSEVLTAEEDWARVSHLEYDTAKTNKQQQDAAFYSSQSFSTAGAIKADGTAVARIGDSRAGQRVIGYSGDGRYSGDGGSSSSSSSSSSGPSRRTGSSRTTRRGGRTRTPDEPSDF